jgi:hypothetical protein
MWEILGGKCKFSHDRDVERKVEKLNIYEDIREREKDKKNGRPIFALLDFC